MDIKTILDLGQTVYLIVDGKQVAKGQVVLIRLRASSSSRKIIYDVKFHKKGDRTDYMRTWEYEEDTEIGKLFHTKEAAVSALVQRILSEIGEIDGAE